MGVVVPKHLGGYKSLSWLLLWVVRYTTEAERLKVKHHESSSNMTVPFPMWNIVVDVFAMIDAWASL